MPLLPPLGVNPAGQVKDLAEWHWGGGVSPLERWVHLNILSVLGVSLLVQPMEAALRLGYICQPF